MAKYVYPAVFTPEETGYSVVFPDIECCYTCGDSMADALDMARDVLALRLCDMENAHESIPQPSDVRNVSHDDGEIVSLVGCDTIEYRRQNDNRAVKKTLTIPSWLNAMAEAEDLNFSGILQEALKDRLHIRP